MRIILLPFLICFYISAAAQAPVITSSDMPAVNDTFRYSVAANAFLSDPVPTDTNYTWDFSSLLSASQYVDTFKPLNNTNIVFAMIFASAEYAIKFNFDQSLGNVPVSDVFNFYNLNQQKYELLGFGTILNGIPIPVAYFTPDVLYNFPMTYGNIDSSHSTFTVNIPTVGTAFHAQTRTNYVDGWGTLILPSGTYNNVLRIRSVIAGKDSVTGTPAAIYTTTIEYKWISKTSKVPLLEIEKTNGITTRVSYRDNYINFTSVEEKPAEVAVPVIFPNPAGDVLNIKYAGKANAPISVEIFDLKGRLTHIKKGKIPSNSHFSIETSNMESGIYFIKIQSDEVSFIEKVMILKD